MAAGPNYVRPLRRVHRYLGLFIGIQFLLWTIGGLYFSWSNMDRVHGDDLIKAAQALPPADQLLAPDQVLSTLRAESGPITLRRMELYMVGADPVYRVDYTHSGGEGEPASTASLFDARNGTMRGPLSEAEARALAESRYAGEGSITAVQLITEDNEPDGHHEYRGGPLPAYAIEFADARRTTLYVAPELARITSVRNREWRIFDFLWMLHTMDFETRDEITNRLLRAFSILGLATVCSGFALFFATSPLFRRRARRSLSDPAA